MDGKKKKKNAVVEWEVFYSERAQREYYYNRATKIVTWILPDEWHLDGISIPEMHETGSMTSCSTSTKSVAVGGSSNLSSTVTKTTERPKKKPIVSPNTVTMVFFILSLTVTILFWGLQARPQDTSLLKSSPTLSTMEVEILEVPASSSGTIQDTFRKPIMEYRPRRGNQLMKTLNQVKDSSTSASVLKLENTVAKNSEKVGISHEGGRTSGSIKTLDDTSVIALSEENRQSNPLCRGRQCSNLTEKRNAKPLARILQSFLSGVKRFLQKWTTVFQKPNRYGPEE